MYTAKISITQQQDTSQDGEPCTCETCQLSDLLGTLYKNGQVISREYPFFVEDTVVSTIVNIADKDSLDDTYHNIYTQRDIATIGRDRLTFEVLGKDPEVGECCQCENHKQRQYLILHTNYSAISSPVDCGNCQSPIPLYKLPPIFDSDEYLNILTWEQCYKAYDHLQMNGFNETFAIEQMYSLQSELTINGREIAHALSEKVGIPCYYYLYVYYGDSIEKEKQRKCPCCDGEWLLDKKISYFDFKCDTCYLLSNIAYDLP